MTTSIKTDAARTHLTAAGMSGEDLAWLDRHGWNDGNIPPPSTDEIAAYERREAALNSAIAGLGSANAANRWKASSPPPSGRDSPICAIAEKRTTRAFAETEVGFPFGQSGLLSLSAHTGGQNPTLGSRRHMDRRMCADTRRLRVFSINIQSLNTQGRTGMHTNKIIVAALIALAAFPARRAPGTRTATPPTPASRVRRISMRIPWPAAIARHRNTWRGPRSRTGPNRWAIAAVCCCSCLAAKRALLAPR